MTYRAGTTKNERARARALAAGRAAYRCEVVDQWPACVTCGELIRGSAHTGRPGLWRLCGCHGVVWRSLVVVGDGWERVEEGDV